MKYLKTENRWSLTPDAMLDVRDALPAGNYTVCQHPMTKEYYLEESEMFSLPSKLYGKVVRHGNRILETFQNRQPDTQVGVFLSGTKGSGKTLLAKYIANVSDLPVIIVNTPFSDERFMRTIQGIRQPAVVIFDEFEKLYDKDAQESILTLFDGVYTARNKIMVITCNDKYSVRDFFHNRPSRLRYAIAFSGLDSEFIQEYCNDRLEDSPKYLEGILGLAAACEEFNFDMLQTLVDELNRYGGELSESVEILNVKPVGGNNKGTWKIKVKDLTDPTNSWIFESNDKLTTSPMVMISSERFGSEIDVHISLEESKKPRTKGGRSAVARLANSEEDEIRHHYLSLRSEHLFKVDPYSGTYLFKIQGEGGREFMFQIAEESPPRTMFGNYSIGSMDF